MKTGLLIATLVLVSSGIIACDTKKDPPKLALTEVEDMYYSLFCDKIMSCEFNAFFSVVIRDRQHCLDFVASQAGKDGPGLSDMIAAVNKGTVVYNGVRAYSCLEAMKAQSCDDFDHFEPGPCREVFTGTIADGTACFLNEECISRYCDTASGCPGVCKPAVAEGEVCVISDQCIPGAKCVLGRCTFFSAPVTAGGDCDPDEDWCAYGLFCHPGTEQCTARLAAGSECDGSHELECAQGTICMGINQDKDICVTLTVVEAAGEVCDYNDGRICAAYENLSCAIDDFQSFTGTCAPAPGLGETCFDADEMVLTVCDMFGDLYCDMSAGFQVDGTCRAKKAGGNPCDNDDQCLSDWCDEDTCAQVDEVCLP